MSHSVKENPSARSVDRSAARLGANEAPGSPEIHHARFSVALKLTLLVGSMLGILLAGLLIASGLYWRNVLRSQLEPQMTAIAASRRDLVRTQLATYSTVLDVNTDRGEFRGFLGDVAAGRGETKNRDYAQDTLRFIADGKTLLSASLTDKAGKIILSSDPSQVGRIVSASSEFQASVSEPHVGWPHNVGGRFEATVAAPVKKRDQGRERLGTLIATANVSSMAAPLRDVGGLAKTGEAILGVRNGEQFHFLFPPRTSPELTSVPIASAPFLAAASGPQRSFYKMPDYRGVPVLAASDPIGYRDWTMIVKIDEAEAYAPVDRALRLMGLAGAGAIVLALIAASVLAHRFTRPVRRLVQAAARLAAGDDTAQVPVRSTDELGALSESFNEMTAALRARSDERDAAEEALRKSELNARQIAESLPQLVWTCDANGACDYLSPQWVTYTGLPAENQLGTGWLAQIHPEDRERVMQCWSRIAAEGGCLDIEFRIRRHDGTFRWFRTCASPLKDEAGRVVKWFGTNTDVDTARHAELALRDADRRKDEFLAMLGHELRNPLSAISNAAQLWKEAQVDDPESAELARGIVEWQTTHLARLVDDLLDVARITEGKIELRKRPVDAARAVRRAVEGLRPLLDERQHHLILQLSEGRPLRIDADPTRLEQIITNLLTNAAKYTPDGGLITVAARREGADTVIEVTDSGIGIQPEMVSKIFELFTQADHSLDRSVGGLGLGLSLSRKLVELHGGTLCAHSDGTGMGATFTVRLPTSDQIETPPPPAPVHSGPAHRHRILLVDDNIDTARSLGQLLTRRGHEVAVAHDGLAAVRVAYEFRPDVLLLDLGLPGMDGYALARQLRAEGFPTTPMIAISGYAQESDRARAREAGFNRHFAKPVDFEALAALLAADAGAMIAGD